MAAGRVLQIKRGLASTIGTLSAGELGFTTDTLRVYVGDGVTNHFVGGNIAESDVLNLTTDLAAKFPVSGGILEGNLAFGPYNTSHGIVLTNQFDSDELFSGIVVSGIASVNIPSGNLCYMNSSFQWAKANAAALATSGPVILGICTQQASANGLIYILLIGVGRSSLFPASIAGATQLYVSTTDGIMTTTPPSATDNVIRVVGWALTAEPNTIYFNPSQDYLTHI